MQVSIAESPDRNLYGESLWLLNPQSSSTSNHCFESRVTRVTKAVIASLRRD